jgi:hypothetical protein
MRVSKSLLVRLSVLLLPIFSFAQEDKKSLEIYGFILVDGGYNFNSMHPDWFDVMRPTKLPKYKNEFGTSGNYFISVRQTRVGVRSNTKTRFGDLKTQFDFDFYGFGKDAGQTTIHLVNGFAQLGKLLVGQTPSTIMDTDVFPVTLDYWGPCSRIFLLNVQVRYTPVFTQKERLAIGLERPGATADGYDYSNSVDSRQLKPRLPLPNLTAHYRRNWNWGYTRIAAIAKSIQWQNISDTSSVDLSGKDIGWGINVSTVVDLTKKIKFKFQGEWGEGFQNHIADPSPDVALQSNPSNPASPAKGKALPVWGFFSFIEYKWSEKLKSSMGYSTMEIKNADLQSPDAFRMGQYALFNLRYYAVENLMLGIEYQYGRRDNFSDGFHSSCHKIQFAFKCNFSKIFTAE